MKIAVAITLSAFLLAAAHAFSNQYSIATDARQQVVWRVNQFTGELVACGVDADGKPSCLKMPSATISN